jgi:hypothetical protein
LQKRERGRDGERWSRETAKLILMAFTKATLPMYYVWRFNVLLALRIRSLNVWLDNGGGGGGREADRPR